MLLHQRDQLLFFPDSHGISPTLLEKLIVDLLAIFLFNETTLGESSKVYLGFDRNAYPGYSSLLLLRKGFRYTSY